MFNDFVHLHLHSDRSALDSITKIDELVPHVRQLGMKACALTDHGVMTGAISFYEECLKTQNKDKVPVDPIKPLLGCEIYISPTDDYTLRETLEGHPKQQNYHLVLLAKNAEGVKQLYELSSRGYLEGFYYKPRVSLKLIEEIGKDLIVGGACIKGPVSWQLANGNKDKAYEYLGRLKESFKDRFYLELMDHGLDWQKKLNEELLIASKKFGVPWMPTQDAHFLKKEDSEVHNLIKCVHTGKTISTLEMKYPEELYVKSPEEMAKIFSEPACRKTLEIAEQIDIKLDLGQTIFPVPPPEK